jgi:mannan endo-1,4-beta-mannosidase
MSIPSLSPEAARLLAHLRDVQQVKKYTLSGIYDKNELDFIKSTVGAYPVVRGVDMMRYSPVFVKYAGPNEDEVSNYISDTRAHGFLNTASWHWSPDIPGVGQNNYYNAFYDMNLDVMDHLDALQNDIDAIARPLQQFRDAKIPVLWRPLHEVTQYAWFWWSKDVNTFKTIWNLMWDRLVNHHKLDNLIWVWNPAHNYNMEDASYYPGDDKVHLTAIDYPSDPVAAYSGLKNIAPTKVAAVAEMSWNDWPKFISDFDRAPYAYIVSWAKDQGSIKAGADAVHQVYRSDVPRTLPWNWNRF